MEIIYKEKSIGDIEVEIIVKGIDFNTVSAAIRIEKEKCGEKNFTVKTMNRDLFINQRGVIRLNKTAVTINPRANFFAKKAGLEAMRFTLWSPKIFLAFICMAADN